MSKTIYFMRHAQSAANEQEILASRQQFPLTERGRQDAEAIAEQFTRTTTLGRVVASPLVRAQQTAAPFARRIGLTVETDKRITEQELGVYSGMSYAQLESEPDYEHDRTQRWTWVPKGGGESYEMIAQRLEPFFAELDRADDATVLYVSHAVTLRLVRARLERTLPKYPEEIAKNGEIWKVDYNGSTQVHRVESLFFGSPKGAASRA